MYILRIPKKFGGKCVNASLSLCAVYGHIYISMYLFIYLYDTSTYAN